MGTALKDNKKKLKHNMRVHFQGRSTNSSVKANARLESAVAAPFYFVCDAHSKEALYLAFATTCQHVATP